MPGPGTTESSLGTAIAIAAAMVGVVGYTVFGWRFGDASGTVPQALGLGVALFAVVLVLYRRFGPA